MNRPVSIDNVKCDFVDRLPKSIIMGLDIEDIIDALIIAIVENVNNSIIELPERPQLQGGQIIQEGLFGKVIIDPPPKRKIIHGTKREGKIVFCTFLFLVLGYLLSVLYVFYYGGNNV